MISATKAYFYSIYSYIWSTRTCTDVLKDFKAFKEARKFN